MNDPVPIRDAATIIVLRDKASNPSVLMGQRGKSAAFMPGKFVFPGGAIDPVDAIVPVGDVSQQCSSGLADQSPLPPQQIIAAAVRELWEETGQILGRPHDWDGAPKGWRGFADTGHAPNGEALQFIFRAVTPIGAPRRFDARFLLAHASDLATDPDDFSGAEDELSHLQWVPMTKAREFDLPFITQVVLAELRDIIDRGALPSSVPFFANEDEQHLVRRLDGRSPL